MKKTLFKILITAIIIIFIFTISLNVLATGNPSTWAVNEIEKAKQYNLTTEKVLTNFHADITREEFCELAMKLYYALGGQQLKVQYINPFIDTSNPDVITAYYLNFVEGITKNEFIPNQSILREEIAIMFYRIIKRIRPELDLKTSHELLFDDISEVSWWAKEAIKYMNAIGIINGLDNNLLAPKATTTKEQAIVFSLRVFENFFVQKKEPSVGFFWEVSNENNKIYLLGSIHIGNEDLYPLNKNMELAFEESNVLIVETNPTDADNLNLDILQKVFYLDGTTIKDHISEELYVKLCEALINLDQNIAYIKSFKPWFAALTLQDFDIVKHGYTAELGIDNYYITKALKDKNKEIIELESMEYQINTFADFSHELQEYFLKSTLNDLTNSEQTYLKLLDAWKTGNIDKMEEILFASGKNNLMMSMINEKI